MFIFIGKDIDKEIRVARFLYECDICGRIISAEEYIGEDLGETECGCERVIEILVKDLKVVN